MARAATVVAGELVSLVAQPDAVPYGRYKKSSTGRAGLEAMGFRVRRLPVGFCLRFFVFLLSRVVPDKTTS